MKGFTHPPRSGTKVKCERCRVGKVSCSWGDKIPVQLHDLKVAIHQGRSIATEITDPVDVQVGPDSIPEAESEVDSSPDEAEAEVVFSPEKLDLLRMATRVARAELGVRLLHVRRWEMSELCRGFHELRTAGNRLYTR